MPTDERLRDDIAAAVAAYDSANPSTPLPHNAARLLAIMLPSEDPVRPNHPPRRQGARESGALRSVRLTGICPIWIRDIPESARTSARL